MAVLDDILGFGSPSGAKPLQTAPAPIDASLQGAPTSVGSAPEDKQPQMATQNTTAPMTQASPVDKQQTAGTEDLKPEPVVITGFNGEKVVLGKNSKVRTDAIDVIGKPGTMDHADSDKPKMTYVDLLNAMYPNKPETPEERAKREKREKREAIFSAIGDGISALSNLFFTTRYAPNSYNASNGMSARTKERWEALRKEREANNRAYYNAYVQALSMDRADERDDRNWRHTLEREKIADERYEVKAAQDKALADLNEKLKQHQITAAEFKAEQERIAAQYADGTEKLKQENIKAGIAQKNASAGASKANAAASYARAGYYNKRTSESGVGGKKSGPTLQLEEDDPMRFDDAHDYDRTVMRLAPDYNVPTEKVEVTEWGMKYNTEKKIRERVPKKTRTVQRPVKDIAADIEREAAKRKGAKTKDSQPAKSAKSQISIYKM